jgi:hypothetical protein
MMSELSDYGVGNRARWQFSLRVLFVLTAIVAAVVAFAANYPTLFLALLFAFPWLLMESGIVAAFTGPAARAKHPVLSVVMLSVSGGFCIVFSIVLWWSVFSSSRAMPFWAPMIPAILFGGLGCFLFYLLRETGRTASKTNNDLSAADTS